MDALGCEHTDAIGTTVLFDLDYGLTVWTAAVAETR